MYIPLWQIGLDIQSNSVRSVALQRRRYGWQLRHWWQSPLPENTFRDESLHHSAYLIPIIQHWRRSLPRHFSLRVALPAPCVLQQILPVPAQNLDQEAMGWHVESQLGKWFPLGGQAVAVDYRHHLQEPDSLYVTVTRQEEVDRWMSCLAAAELVPQVIDITPCALRTVAKAAGVNPSSLLIHRGDSHLLWVSPQDQPLVFGVLPITEPDVALQIAAAKEAYRKVSGLETVTTSYSSTAENDRQTLGSETLFSPFRAIQQVQPPLPRCDSAYALAAGLALRSDDQV